MTKHNVGPLVLSAAAAIGLGIGLASGVDPAQANAECGRVCITDLHLDGSNVHVAWTGNEQFAKYTVYWERNDFLTHTDFAEVQSRVVGPDQFAFDIPNAPPGATYKVAVSGCLPYTPFFADSSCVTTDQRYFTT